MISTFVSHELNAFWRSKNTGKSIAVKVVMGVLIAIMFLYVLAAGLFLNELLEEFFPNTDVVVSFCGFILMYYLADLLMRLQLQELPTLRVQPYLHLPIPRNTVVKYLAATSALSFFNLWPIILFTPFICRTIAAESAGAAVSFFVTIIALAIFNNYLALYIKRKSNLNGWIFLLITSILVLFTLGDRIAHLYSIKDISYSIFGALLVHPAYAVIAVLMMVAMYWLNFIYLKRNLYLEDLNSAKRSSYKSSSEYSFLNRFGSVGDLVANEIKLILRNKRPRSTVVMSLFFMFYGLVFYMQPKLGSSDFSMLFVGVFMTGIFIINYGQFMYSWQAAYFDGILVSKTKFADFLKAKLLLFTAISTIAFLLTIPYVYFGWRVLIVHFVMYLWNIGVNTVVILFFANRNHRRIDLSKAASFNWEGVGATQLLAGFPLLLTPMLLFTPFRIFGAADWGLGFLAVISIICILLRPWFIKKLEEDFNTKKFSLAEGFRNK